MGVKGERSGLWAPLPLCWSRKKIWESSGLHDGVHSNISSQDIIETSILPTKLWEEKIALISNIPTLYALFYFQLSQYVLCGYIISAGLIIQGCRVVSWGAFFNQNIWQCLSKKAHKSLDPSTQTSNTNCSCDATVGLVPICLCFSMYCTTGREMKKVLVSDWSDISFPFFS